MIALSCLVLAVSLSPADPATGLWRAWLDSPGGELPFGIELSKVEDRFEAMLLNGEERIPVPSVTWSGAELTLAMPHYDSRIVATLAPDGRALEGTWTKRSGPETWTKMTFHARAGVKRRFAVERTAPKTPVPARFRVKFESSDDPAVLQLSVDEQGTASATFLTTTGDYRYLAGAWSKNTLHLSCFDGAHAFLFRAERTASGELRGDFWSRDSWHEGWTAKPDPGAALPDDFAQTRWVAGIDLEDLTFPDLEGRPRSLADPEFQGKARILYVFGSWCPNCHDQAAYLKELQERFGRRGLSIVGLAFELTGDFERNVRQVKRYQARHGSTYPILIAGPSDKGEATEALGALDRVRSYPTTIFLDEDGNVEAIHTGFTGPATGPTYDRLRTRFETIIERLLNRAEDGGR